jgi:hypothetical protein
MMGRMSEPGQWRWRKEAMNTTKGSAVCYSQSILR